MMAAKRTFILFLSTVVFTTSYAQTREHLRMDFNWRFAFGHPYDTKKDFSNGTSYFSYLTKAGYGDGAAAFDFDDRAWRLISLPHDWAVEQPFSEKGSFSHGFKAAGKNFPETSVGWYRKTFSIPTSDFGRRIHIAFDGVFRNSTVWVNGHYIGTEQSGYDSFEYDITDYLHYGEDNVVAVRVDATMEEGWFYEGAGIYRHVWLNKTDAVHVPSNGLWATSQVNGGNADVTANSIITNDAKTERTVTLQQAIADANGKVIVRGTEAVVTLQPFGSKELSEHIEVTNPSLWSIETPYLYHLITTIKENGTTLDSCTIAFGIRTIRFDANEGFFLNGKQVKIKGTNNHQDHAGVGAALPDALQEYRIAQLKKLGSNAYRCSHNPPAPELLDACDRMGMLVIDENRLMGSSQYHLTEVKRMILRDRNHPSIISWSIGNEEWAIENNSTGARIAATMQEYVKSLDSTRPATAAFSGGIGSNGITTVMDLQGINYVANKNTDTEHKLFPRQKIWGTEEGSTVATRGIYADDTAKHYRAAYDVPQQPQGYLSIEQGWQWYAQRNYLAGMFIWTGFDYRGEPTPFGWPSNVALFGMLDNCGFPKDDAYYLQSWWTDKPVLHLLPHWNRKGKEGQPVDVWVYSNCDEVEMFLNKKSLGKQQMPLNSHLAWKVMYQPGTLEAVGYKKGKKMMTDVVKTTSDAASVRITASTSSLSADGEDIAVITVDELDKNKLHVPTADDTVYFSVEGPGRIIGVGNGDPTSMEKDRFIETIQSLPILNLKEKRADGFANPEEIESDYDDSGWSQAFRDARDEGFAKKNKIVIYRGGFTLPQAPGKEDSVSFLYKCIGTKQSLYINGHLVADDIKRDSNVSAYIADKKEFRIDRNFLIPGRNTVTIIASPLVRQNQWHTPNEDPGSIKIVTPAAQWKRSLFNGLAQVMVQSTGVPGTILIKATSGKRQPANLSLISVSGKGKSASN